MFDPVQVMCGNGSGIHVDVFDSQSQTLTNVVVYANYDLKVERLSPRYVDLSHLHLVGYWEHRHTASSNVSGVGLVASRPIPSNACLGLLIRVYTPRYFNCWPGRFMNHGAGRSNVALRPRLDPQQRLLQLFGVTTQAVAEGEELLVDYLLPECPGLSYFKPHATSASWPHAGW